MNSKVEGWTSVGDPAGPQLEDDVGRQSMNPEEGSSSKRRLPGGDVFWLHAMSLLELHSTEVGEVLLDELWDCSRSAEWAEGDAGTEQDFAAATRTRFERLDLDFLAGGPPAMKDLSSLRVSTNRGTLWTSGESRGATDSVGVSSALRFLPRLGPHCRL